MWFSSGTALILKAQECQVWDQQKLLHVFKTFNNATLSLKPNAKRWILCSCSLALFPLLFQNWIKQERWVLLLLFFFILVILFVNISAHVFIWSWIKSHHDHLRSINLPCWYVLLHVQDLCQTKHGAYCIIMSLWCSCCYKFAYWGFLCQDIIQFAKHVSLTNHLISSINCDFHNEIQSKSFNVALFQELELLGLLYGLFQQFISFDQRLVKTFFIVSRSSAAVRI